MRERTRPHRPRLFDRLFFGELLCARLRLTKLCHGPSLSRKPSTTNPPGLRISRCDDLGISSGVDTIGNPHLKIRDFTSIRVLYE